MPAAELPPMCPAGSHAWMPGLPSRCWHNAQHPWDPSHLAQCLQSVEPGSIGLCEPHLSELRKLSPA